VAPAYWNYYSDNMTWPGTYILVAHMLYTQFGDAEPVIRHYPSMKKWMTYMTDKYLKEGILTKDKYGDWCVPPESPELIHSRDSNRNTDGRLIATAYYYRLLHLMADFARLQRLGADAKAYGEQAEAVKTAFNDRFFNREKGYYSNNAVTANLLPFYFGMVPAGARAAVLQQIVDKITIENKGHITTGVIGTQWIMRGLTRNGHADAAYAMAGKRDYPGWGYMVENGATTIWELWNGNTANPQMNSGNHVMLLGDLITWFYEDLAGIAPDAAQPGFQRIVMRPVPVTGLTGVKGSYESVYGTVRSEWTRAGNKFRWKVTVPPNTKAEIHLPVRSGETVREGGNKLTGAVRQVRREGDRMIYEIGSGDYDFTTTL
jgi:alpha-L-rhamnosidase